MSQLDDLERVFSESSSSVRFSRRPDPVPGDLRIAWRLSALALVLTRCRGESAGMQQLHLLLAAFRSPLMRQSILRGLAGGLTPDETLVRNDPALTRTIRIAEAMELVEVRSKGTTVRLADKGRTLARLVSDQAEVLKIEKAFLGQLPVKMTQKQFQSLLESS